MERLNRLHPKVIDLSLGRIERLLGRLGNPEDGLPPVVHVAGTNGKGSVIAFLRAMVEAAGLSAHVYTSPHLMRFNERIRIAGEAVSDNALDGLLDDCEAANAGAPITFFEITTAAAFLAFARAPADVALLETGLGGRLDATNLVRRPALTVMTPIALDHQHFLGRTLTAIAGEKAGILKPGVACVCAAQHRRADAVIARHAHTLKAPLMRDGRDWRQGECGGGWTYDGPGGSRSFPLPGLPGAHQVANAGLAVAAADQLTGLDITDAAMARGLGQVDWPGRLQELGPGRLEDLLPGDWELWADGAHNPAAARVLAAQAGRWRDKPLHLVLGMMTHKRPHEFLKPLAGKVETVRTVAIPGEPGSLGAEETAAAARALSMDAQAAAGIAEALVSIARQGSGPARVLITGSLYLVGAALAGNVR